MPCIIHTELWMNFFIVSALLLVGVTAGCTLAYFRWKHEAVAAIGCVALMGVVLFGTLSYQRYADVVTAKSSPAAAYCGTDNVIYFRTGR